jgi:serine/threonine-protein kinase PknG
VIALACALPGCDGAIEDGYCNLCGIAPSEQPGSPPGHAASSHQTASSRRGQLGAGLLEIPPITASDPADAVMADPQVPEGRRFCSSCSQPVGRGSARTPGRAEGFCKNCGTRFSFRPRLQPGDLVAGQYEVLGCLAHGGLGWVYLARDRNVSDRWVVLKGLLNSGDSDAQAAAVAERRFLAEVEHPNIVRIYNFVEHPDSRTGDPTGYIVMEFVGGQSLRQIVLERRQAHESVPVAHALAYAIEVLPALGYLHRLGLVYCDFKPDNVIQVEEQLKLIDLGGVRRIDDDDSPIYGTVGYQAPEIASAGPSPSSDLYTVGRSLAVLSFEFSGYTGAYQHRLPEPGLVPVLAEHESFYRLLRRATDADPTRRFTSAADMAEQMTGVLREVLSAGDGTPRPAFSTRFTPELRAIGAVAAAGEAGVSAPPARAEIVAGLPVPLVDSSDPAAGFLATLTTLGPDQLAEALQQAIAVPGQSSGVADGAEAHLALARARIAMGDLAGARRALSQIAGRGFTDWRVTWYRALVELLAGRVAAARDAFDAVFDFLPGELAPKLALGLAAEAAGDTDVAARYFETVWATDRMHVSAAFGLARVRLAAGDNAAAVDVLGTVPQTSTSFAAAQIAAIRARLTPSRPGSLSAADLSDAGGRLELLPLDASIRHTLTAEILTAGLGLLQAGMTSANGRLLGCQLTDKDLRLGLERTYRGLARLSASQSARYALIDLANGVRPRTLT